MKKRFFALLLVISMVLLMFSGCGKKDQADSGDTKKTTSDKSADKDTGEKKETGSSDTSDSSTASKYQTTYGSKMFDNVKIKVQLFDRSNAPEGSTITENRWTEYAKEQMKKVGIELEFVPVPRWDEIPKMQSMMASQTAPDITLTYTMSHVEQYFKDGGVWDLSEFIDGPDQALNMKAYLGEDVINIGRTSKDELYGIVAKRATTAKSNLFLRKDWMDKLNLEVPTTPDELYDVIYKMKYENPDARNTTLGAIVWNAWNLKAAFSELVGDPKEVAISLGDDAFGDYYDPGNREYYRFMNKLYNAGLLNQEYYTMAEDDFKGYVVTGDVAFFEGSVNFAVDVLRGSLLKTLQENVPGADIVSIPPLKNVNDGKQYSAAYAAAGIMSFCPLTASEEVVEACMTYLDWMCTEEGGFVFYHGFEGEHYEFDENGTPKVLDATYNAQDKDWIRTDIFLVGNQGYFMTVDDFNACTSLEAPGYEQHVVDNYENALTGIIISDQTYTSPSTPDLITDIGIVRDEYTVSVVTCPESAFDATYDEYMKELEAVGIKTIIEERTAHFNEMYN